MNRLAKRLVVLFGAAGLFFALAAFGSGEEVQAQATKAAGLEPFKQNCGGCHTIGGGKAVGPDLKGLEARAPSREWVLSFVKDPKGTNDDYAKKMKAENGDLMGPMAALGDAVLNDIIDFIYAGGPGLEVKTIEIVMSAENIELGRQLFTGETRLKHGGPACISCHELSGLEGFGGGKLASTVGNKFPSLDAAHTRNGGDMGLYNAILNPQFPVMKSVFAPIPAEDGTLESPLTEEEANALTAFLADRAANGTPDTGRDYFPVYGIVGALLLLLVLDLAWLKRFRNVRKTLVGESE